MGLQKALWDERGWQVLLGFTLWFDGMLKSFPFIIFTIVGFWIGIDVFLCMPNTGVSENNLLISG